jgi:hypothetical protein
MVNKVRIEEKHNFLGYNISITNNRISTIASKVLILCLESSLYCFVSLGLIKPDECQKLFGTNVQEQVLQKINKRIKELVTSLKEVVNLTSKFCTWVFGIQAEIYSLLINFPKRYAEHVQKLEQRSA